MPKKETGHTVSAFAAARGHDRRTVKRRVESGDIKPCRKKSGVKFYLVADLERVMSVAENPKGESVSAKMAAAKLKRENAKARTAEVEARKAEESVIDIGEHRREFARAGLLIKAKLLAIPSSVATMAANKSPAEVEQIIRVPILNALRELSEQFISESK